MLADEIMTADVVTVSADTAVSEIAALLLERRISAVPVVDAEGRVIGIVSEGDLMRRPESDTESRTGSWWLNLFADSETLAGEYTKSHGLLASDVMTRDVVTVSTDTPVAEIAQTLEEHHIKRVPVIDDARLVGIVSRANLLHGLASRKAPAPVSVGTTDRTIREEILRSLKGQRWAELTFANVTVEDGNVHLWGMAQSDAQIRALEVAVAEIQGVVAVENHMNRIEPRMFFGE